MRTLTLLCVVLTLTLTSNLCFAIPSSPQHKINLDEALLQPSLMENVLDTSKQGEIELTEKEVKQIREHNENSKILRAKLKAMLDGEKGAVFIYLVTSTRTGSLESYAEGAVAKENVFTTKDIGKDELSIIIDLLARLGWIKKNFRQEFTFYDSGENWRIKCEERRTLPEDLNVFKISPQPNQK